MFTFSVALTRLKEGRRICRSGWNGKGMFLVLINSYDWNPKNEHLWAGLDKSPWIAIKTADQKVVPWVTSQQDVLADDWMILD